MPQIVHATEGSTLADIVERVLDKGVVIAGDIRIRLLEVDLLTINIRLLIASVDKAREIGVDWWRGSTFLGAQTPEAPRALPPPQADDELQELRRRLERLEQSSQ